VTGVGELVRERSSKLALTLNSGSRVNEHPRGTVNAWQVIEVTSGTPEVRVVT
jgi:hypothetical protein